MHLHSVLPILLHLAFLPLTLSAPASQPQFNANPIPSLFPKSPKSSNLLPIPLLEQRTTPTITTGPGWTIKNFTRNCTDPNICTYVLGIDNGVDEKPIPCTIEDKVVPATNHSFYDVGCAPVKDYHLSWGWDYKGNFTVMTVVHVPSSEEAFFGYDKPNDRANGFPVSVFKDQGPSKIQHL